MSCVFGNMQTCTNCRSRDRDGNGCVIGNAGTHAGTAAGLVMCECVCVHGHAMAGHVMRMRTHTDTGMMLHIPTVHTHVKAQQGTRDW